MHLTLLGTGCPSVDTDRYGPSALVRVGDDARVLVDCGSGVPSGCSKPSVLAATSTQCCSPIFTQIILLICSNW